MDHRRTKLVLLACCILGGVALAWLALRNAGGSAPTRSGSSQGAPPAEFRAGESLLDLRPDRAGVERATAAVAGRIEAVAASQLGAESAASLAASVALRLALILEPDYEAWLRATRPLDPDVGLDEEGGESAAFRDEWENCARVLAGAPIGLEGIAVRRIEGDPRAFPMDRVRPGTIILAGGPGLDGIGTVELSLPEGDEIEGVEALIPTRLRTNAHGVIPCTAGLRFARPRGGTEWQPVAMFVYLGAEAFEKDLTPPVF